MDLGTKIKLISLYPVYAPHMLMFNNLKMHDNLFYSK